MARGAAEALQESGSAAPAAPSGEQREATAAGLCPICLGDLDNAAHVDTCLHTFCFACIRQWAAVCAACPLCRQRFGRILHSVRADDDYQETDEELLERAHELLNELKSVSFEENLRDLQWFSPERRRYMGISSLFVNTRCSE